MTELVDNSLALTHGRPLRWMAKSRTASYTRIQLNRISASVLTPTITQSVSPCSRGRTPTFAIVSLLRLAPIKNNVTVRPSFPMWLRAPKAVLNRGSKVLTSAAPQQNRMNHGHSMPALLFNTNPVATDSGTIHKASANLMVSPTTKPNRTYFAVDQTTKPVE